MPEDVVPIKGECPNCKSTAEFIKSDSPGPYYICLSCEGEVEARNIK